MGPTRGLRFMEQSTLAEILGVEKDIRARLETERKQADEWLEDARRELEQEHQESVSQIQSAAAVRRAAALQAARDRAAADVKSAVAAAADMAQLGDDVLRPIVRRHLAFLLPESAQ